MRSRRRCVARGARVVGGVPSLSLAPAACPPTPRVARVPPASLQIVASSALTYLIQALGTTEMSSNNDRGLLWLRYAQVRPAAGRARPSTRRAVRHLFFASYFFFTFSNIFFNVFNDGVEM